MYPSKILLLAKDSVDLDSKSYVGWTPLLWAVVNGHEAVVKLLLERDSVDPNSKDTEYGMTPLLWAAEKGHEAVVKHLLTKDSVDPDSVSISGWTPLLLAETFVGYNVPFLSFVLSFILSYCWIH